MVYKNAICVGNDKEICRVPSLKYNQVVFVLRANMNAHGHNVIIYDYRTSLFLISCCYCLLFVIYALNFFPSVLCMAITYS